MKKVICVILALVMFGIMGGCSDNRQLNTEMETKNAQFDTESAFFHCLNGMYIQEDNDADKTFYIFQDGKVFVFNDAQFCTSMENLFCSLVAEDKLTVLCGLDYKTAIDLFDKDAFLENTSKSVVVKPENGLLVIDQGKSYEKQIVVTDEGVFAKGAYDDKGVLLTKLSHIPDFSGEHFEALFRKTKENYTISTADFWADTKEYGAMVKRINPEIDGWDLITQNETTTAYKSSEWVPSIKGSLFIDDASVVFTREVTMDTAWVNPSFSIVYMPGSHVIITEKDNPSLDMKLLLYYATKAVENFPGAADSVELFEIIQNEISMGNYEIRDSATIVTKTINGITYKVYQGTNGMWGLVEIKAGETMKLSDIAEFIDATTESGDVTESSEEVTDVTAYVTDSYRDEESQRFIPEIIVEGISTDEVNDTIYAELQEYISAPESWRLEYEYEIKNDIISVCSHAYEVDGWYVYYIYNVSTVTGEFVSNQVFIEQMGLTEEKYRQQLIMALENIFYELYGDFEQDDFFNSQLEFTLSESNLEKAIPFYTATDGLCVLIPVGSLIGAECYTRIVPLA